MAQFAEASAPPFNPETQGQPLSPDSGRKTHCKSLLRFFLLFAAVISAVVVSCVVVFNDPTFAPTTAPTIAPTTAPTTAPTITCANALVVTSPQQGGSFTVPHTIPIKYKTNDSCTSSHIDVELCKYLSGGGERCFGHSSAALSVPNAVLKTGSYNLNVSRTFRGRWFRGHTVSRCQTMRVVTCTRIRRGGSS